MKYARDTNNLNTLAELRLSAMLTKKCTSSAISDSIPCLPGQLRHSCATPDEQSAKKQNKRSLKNKKLIPKKEPLEAITQTVPGISLRLWPCNCHDMMNGITNASRGTRHLVNQE